VFPSGIAVKSKVTPNAGASSAQVRVTVGADAVARFTRCRFRAAARGGLAAAGRSRVFLDSCAFVECGADLAGSGAHIVAGTSVAGGAGIACAGGAAALVANRLADCCVDARGGARVALAANEFVRASLFVWGAADAASAGDRFRGSAGAAPSLVGAASAGAALADSAGWERATVALQAASLFASSRWTDGAGPGGPSDDSDNQEAVDVTGTVVIGLCAALGIALVIVVGFCIMRCKPRPLAYMNSGTGSEVDEALGGLEESSDSSGILLVEQV
jgi:hypothetical protein